MAFHSVISETLDVCDNLHSDLTNKIRFRERIDLSLLEMLDECDKITFKAFQEGKKMGDIKDKLKDEMDKVYNDFQHDYGELTEVEREFIDLHIVKLDKILMKHGDKHVSDHSNPAKQNLLGQEGGE